MSQEKRWLIYGAYGYSGELVAEEALRRGHRPVLAGRSQEKLLPIAERLGLPHVAVGLDDPTALVNALEDIDLVFHAAGPFVDTSEAMIGACLAQGVHYVDITGEIPALQITFAHHDAAQQKGICLMSGVGFDVVPTDCLARYVADQVPNAKELEIAIAVESTPSPGTTKSSIDGMLRGGLVRRNGVLEPFELGKGGRNVRFSDETRPVLPIPWGDLETAYRTTGIPNITTYLAFPPGVAAALGKTWRVSALALPLLRGVLDRAPLRRALQRTIATRVKGPDQAARQAGHAHIWARAADASGYAAEAWLETVESYEFTARAGVRAVERMFELSPRGALTPAQAFSADFVLEVDGSFRYDRLGETPLSKTRTATLQA
jgi:short subunit dehydrogenase-like uncharacterized protein